MRVVVADDEDIIRTGIVELIRWESLGYELVGEAQDGEEALTLVEELKPEVVVTDIKMPFITGIELLKRIKDLYEPLYTILLTGYDEFKFAQEAVNNGAYAYLLKPVDPVELEQILLQIKQDYQRKQTINSYMKELKTELTFKKRLYGLGDLPEIEQMLIEYGYEPEKLYFNTFIVQIDDYSALSRAEYTVWIESVKSSMYETIQNESKKVAQTVITENKGFTFIVVAWEDSIEKLRKNVADTIGKIRQSIANERISISAAIGHVNRGVDGIQLSYEEAIQALSVKFILGKNKDIYYEDFIDEIGRQKNVEMDVDSIAARINFENREEVAASFDAVMDTIKEKGAYSCIYLHLVMTNIYVYALQLLRKTEIDMDKTFGNPIHRFEEILSKDTADERIEGLKNLLLDIYVIIEKGRVNHFSAYIIKAEEYISENFSKKNLALRDVTAHVAVSQGHFCAEFKKRTGETFIDYLTRIRMEKAKELLTLSDWKVYEVAEMVGYENATYFSTLFKKYYQISPSKFKNSINNGGSD